MAREFHKTEEKARASSCKTNKSYTFWPHMPATVGRVFVMAIFLRMQRRLKRNQGSLEGLGARSLSAQHKDAAAVATILRDIDEEQALILEVVKTLSQIEITPKPGETGAQRRQRALKAQRARRKIVSQALKHHQAAMAIRNRFVKCNLRLVVSVARRFHHHQMPLIDLIQEGNLGLQRVFIALTRPEVSASAPTHTGGSGSRSNVPL